MRGGSFICMTRAILPYSQRFYAACRPHSGHPLLCASCVLREGGTNAHMVCRRRKEVEKASRRGRLIHELASSEDPITARTRAICSICKVYSRPNNRPRSPRYRRRLDLRNCSHPPRAKTYSSQLFSALPYPPVVMNPAP